MKTKYWIILFAALLLVCGGLSIPLLLPGEAATHAEIISDGTLLQTLDLRIDREFQVSVGGRGYNTLTVKNGKIAVTEASCPDHYCMHRGYCNSGTDIVCLPNRLVIRFVGGDTIDAVVG
ncbi:MAG: NusG domain II-containing protein [Oscillospiraceae bacterium]|nr:NusG domain II-containing protein [Oscillospiraceae bacterium]